MEELLLAMHSPESQLYNLQNYYICDFNAMKMIDEYIAPEDKLLKLTEEELQEELVKDAPGSSGSWQYSKYIFQQCKKYINHLPSSVLAWRMYSICIKINFIKTYGYCNPDGKKTRSLLKPYMYQDAKGIFDHITTNNISEQNLINIINTAVQMNTMDIVKALVQAKALDMEQIYIIFNTEQSLRCVYEYLSMDDMCFTNALLDGNYLFIIYLVDEKHHTISCEEVKQLCNNSKNKEEAKHCFKRHTCSEHTLPIKLCQTWRDI